MSLGQTDDVRLYPCSRATELKLIASGELPSFHDTNRCMVLYDDARAFVMRRAPPSERRAVHFTPDFMSVHFTT